MLRHFALRPDETATVESRATFHCIRTPLQTAQTHVLFHVFTRYHLTTLVVLASNFLVRTGCHVTFQGCVVATFKFVTGTARPVWATSEHAVTEA
jgi:hypothetical protein